VRDGSWIGLYTEIVGLAGRISVGLDDLIYIRIIYRFSGASKVNPVYGKTRVKSEFTRSRDAMYCRVSISFQSRTLRVLCKYV
jgi:hypothetical protein